MAQRMQVIVTCDLEHDEPVEGARTFPLSYDGNNYELDLCDQHREEVSSTLGGYVEAARRVGGKAPSKPAKATGKAPSAPDKPGKGEAAKVREWALANGVPVPSRGRVPAPVWEQYRAAV